MKNQAINTQAQDNFVALVAEIQARVTRLQGAIDDHFGIDPDDVN